MGNGATNPNTASGMLPATSNSSPYIITDVGTLFEYGGGPAWKAFDQVPAIGEASTGSPSDSEYINTGGQTKCGIMVDLGEGNEKCFDKFTFAMCAYTSNFWSPARIIIQGSNSVAVSSVTDDITAENWDTLFKSFITYERNPEIGSITLVEPEPGGGYGSWRPEYFCWISTTPYRYYRIMFGCSEDAITYQEENYTPWTDEEEWNHGDNAAAVSELRFIEETFVPAGDEVVFVPEIVTDLAFEPAHRIYRDGITPPVIIVNAVVSTTVYSQYLGIDADTVLMLHFDGENASAVIVDSSAYDNVITQAGYNSERPGLLKGFVEYDLPGFDACCYFPSSYSTSISITNSPLFDLGLSNTPFCIDFWTQLSTLNNIRNERDSFFVRVGTLDTWDSAAGIMYNCHRLLDKGIAFRWSDGAGSCLSLYWTGSGQTPTATWFHIAITFDGVTTRLFVNGVLQDSRTGSYHKPTTCTNTVIGVPFITELAAGNGMMLNEFRVSNGNARWTTDFTVPDVPYIEAFTGRDVVVPVITTTIIPTVRIVIMPPPLTIPEIASVSSFSLKEVQPPGWTIITPDIQTSADFSLVQNIILHSNVVVSNSLGLRILEVIDKLEIPEILIDAGIIVADVFLGSKIQTPEIVINHSMDVVYNPPWYMIHPDQPKMAGVGYDISADFKCIFLYYMVPGTRSAHSSDGAGFVTVYQLSTDYGQTWEIITPPLDSAFSTSVYASTLNVLSENILLMEGSNYDIDPQRPEVRTYISNDSGITWTLCKYHPRWWQPSYEASVSGTLNLKRSNNGEILYTDVVRSLDYGATWGIYAFDSPELFEDYIPIISYNTDGVIDHPLPQFGRIQNESTITNPVIAGDGMVIIAKCRYYELNPDKISVYDYIRTLSGWTDYGVAIYTLTLESPQLEDFELPVFIDHGIGVIISKDAGVTWDVPFCPFGAETYYSGDKRTINYVSSDGSVIIVSGMELAVIPENAGLPEWYRQHTLYHVYLSTDTGMTWVEIDAPIDIHYYTPIVPPEGYVTLITSSVWSLTTCDDMSVFVAYTTLSAGTPGTLIYLSFDNCVTWTEKIIPVQTITLNKIKVSSDGSRITLGQEEIWSALTSDLRFARKDYSPYYDTIISCMAMDSTGNKVFAGGSFLYQSDYSGKVWWPFRGDSFDADYSNCGVSTDGQVILSAVCMTQGGCLQLSTDGGESWKTLVRSGDLITEVLPGMIWVVAPYQWTWCSVSGNGQVLYAGVSNTVIFTNSTYRSTDSGLTWSKLGGFGNYCDAPINYSGSMLIIDGTLKYNSGEYSDITISTNPLHENWSVAMNYTGEIMIAVSGIYGSTYPTVFLGRTFKSVNYGVTWSEMFPCGDVDKPWGTCSINEDGSVMLVGTQCIGTTPGQLFVSSDYGVTWEQQGISPDWHILPSFVGSAISADGSIMYAGGFGLWTNRSMSNEVVVVNKTIPEINIVLAPTIDTSNFGKTIIQSVMAQISLDGLIPTIQAQKISAPINAYRCVLTGAADNLPDIVIPISSFQCRKSLLSSTEIPISPRQINEVVSGIVPYGYARFCELNPESIFCQAE